MTQRAPLPPAPVAAPATPPTIDVATFLEALVAQLRGGGVPAPTPVVPEVAPAPRYLSVAAFAKRAGVSATTVRGWLKDGMPHTNAPGRLRVIVADADRWVELGPGAKASRAQPALSVVTGGKP